MPILRIQRLTAVITARGRPLLVPLQGHQELKVVIGFLETVDQQLHRFHLRHILKCLAERPDPLQFIGMQQQLLLAGSGFFDIDGRIDTLVDQFPASSLSCTYNVWSVSSRTDIEV